MRHIQTLRVYNFVDSKGNKLRLNLGYIDGPIDESPIDNYDKGYRWSFEGYKIPMPVRSGYWFNGFPESVMLDWLKGNGWALHTIVNMQIGTARVYELPNGDDKANETYELSALGIEQGERALHEAVIRLCESGQKIQAVCLYRYVHPCKLQEANRVVTEIIDRQF